MTLGPRLFQIFLEAREDTGQRVSNLTLRCVLYSGHTRALCPQFTVFRVQPGLWNSGLGALKVLLRVLGCLGFLEQTGHFLMYQRNNDKGVGACELAS